MIEKRRPSTTAWLLAGVFAVAATPRAAHANGRFPAANQVVFDPARPEHLVVTSTFGLLESWDSAKSFTWTCDGALGLSGESDAMLAITENGHKVAATLAGIWLGSDCSYRSAPELAGQIVPDLTLDKANPTRVLAFTTLSLGQGLFESALVLSEDQGETWARLDPPLPSDLLPLSVDFAPSDSSRIYLSARSNSMNGYRSELLRSSDAGRSFERYVIPGTTQQTLAFIAGVDATDENQVFVRVDDPLGTVLLASSDGGETFHELFQGSGRLPGFALSGDRKELYFGGPSDGVWAGPSDGVAFQKQSSAAVSCLGYGSDGLYACAESSLGGALLARSRDGGVSFETLLEFGSLCGTRGCAANSEVARACSAEWDALAPTLGTSCGVSEGVPDAGMPSETPSASGCGCTLRPPAWQNSEWCALVVGLALCARCRRRPRLD